MKAISTITHSLCLLVLTFVAPAPHAIAQESDFHEAGPGLAGGLGHARPDTIFDHPEHSFGLFLDGMFSVEDGDYEAQFTSAEAVFQSRFADQWMGFSVVEADEEEVRVSEAALSYFGVGERSSLLGGRFFLDFGKQMQTHVHDLTTPSRPAVLREYLGDESSGDGLQLDHWIPMGGDSSLRFSLSLFDAFESHQHHGGGDEEDHGHDDGLEQDVPALGARVTGTTHAGDGLLQLGASYRGMREFTAHADEAGFADLEGLSSDLIGLDLTYSWGGDGHDHGHDHGHERRWTVGAEYLSFSGDLSVEENDALSILEAYNGDATGWYAYADHKYAEAKSYGLMVSAFDHLEAGGEEDVETTFYHSWNLSDATRVRLALVQTDSAEDGDSLAAVVQLTGFFGDHGHAHAHAHSH